MGRSQLKYRPTRGRGQGESSRGGRGGGSENAGGRGNRGGRGSGSRGRALESNAFRYEERPDEEVGVAVNNSVATTSRQFFSDERQYRDMGDVKESYFRTKAMQQWDADDNEGDDITGTVGIMDFAWIAEQLASVPPSLRFQIDPKFCVDLIDEESEAPTASLENDEQITPEATTISTQPPQDASVSAPGSALDELLALSSSAAAVAVSIQHSSSSASAGSTSIEVVQSTPEPAEQENLEDWLDDVLDM